MERIDIVILQIEKVKLLTLCSLFLREREKKEGEVGDTKQERARLSRKVRLDEKEVKELKQNKCDD